MTAIKLLDLGDECQIWRLKTLIKQLDIFVGSVISVFTAPGSAGDGTWGLVRLVATVGQSGLA
jgi:hypothetical protein